MTLAEERTRLGIAGMPAHRRTRYLRSLSEDALANEYGHAIDTGDETAQELFLAEDFRRIAARDQAAAHQARSAEWSKSPAGLARAARMSEWEVAAHAEYLQAEDACRGNLLSPAGLATGRDPFPWLWTMPAGDFDRYASEDMRRWREFDAQTFTRRRDYMLTGWSAPREDETMMTPEIVLDHDPASLELETGATARTSSSGAVSYADITAIEPDWLWNGRIAFGEVTVVAAKGGTGKTFALCDVAARVTRGDVLPGGSPANPAGSVLIVNAEDDPSTVLVHRLSAARADLTRVHDFSEPDGAPFTLGGPADCTPLLHEEITRRGDVRLVILDPLSGISAFGLTSVVRVQAMMRPLRRVARDTGAAIVIIHHLTKKGDVAGSKAVVDSVRSVLVVDRTEDGTRVFRVEKGNHVADAGAPVRYRIAGDGTAAAVEWLGEETREGREGGPAQDRMLAALRTSPDPLTGQQLAAMTGIPYSSVRVILHKLSQRSLAYAPARGLWRAVPEQSQVTSLRSVN